MKRITGLFTCGSIGYAAIEILWRGYTHWSMALTGGFVFTMMAPLRKILGRAHIAKQCLAGTALITTTEYVVGEIVNRRLKLNVWDYSSEKLNFKGQICAKYSALWFLLSAPAMMLVNLLSNSADQGKKTVAVLQQQGYNKGGIQPGK